jgi:hypothetical protein
MSWNKRNNRNNMHGATIKKPEPIDSGFFRAKLFPYKYSNILKPSYSSYLSAYEDGTECSETSAYKIHTTGNYPEESIEHSEHGESLKSRLRI